MTMTTPLGPASPAPSVGEPSAAPPIGPNSVGTLQRIAEALGLRLVLGFESGPADRPKRELVSA